MDLEGENIVLIVTFLVLISLVYLTGFIVWVCCRHPHTSNDAYDAYDDADPNVTRKRSIFPIASPSPFAQPMTSQNFPLHALVLLLVALNERSKLRQQEAEAIDRVRSDHQHDHDPELGEPGLEGVENNNSSTPTRNLENHVQEQNQVVRSTLTPMTTSSVVPITTTTTSAPLTTTSPMPISTAVPTSTPTAVPTSTPTSVPMTTTVSMSMPAGSALMTREASTMTTFFYEVSLV